MNRVDRLFAILLQLQHKRRVRAADLALVFEVSERTIYRDMTALSESGVPIVALPGAGYELVAGYYLPPLLFTPSEATALFLSIQHLAAHTTGRLHADAASAGAKIAVALPRPLRERTERLAAGIEFYQPQTRFDLDDPHLAPLQAAIEQQRVIRLHYQSYRPDAVTTRDVEPRLLTYANGAWYVSGFCRLRQATRSFRLTRILDVNVLPDTFVVRDGTRLTPAPIRVRVRFAPQMVRWVRERQHYAFQCDEANDEGGAVMVYAVQSLAELIPWLLSWGAAAEPLAPPGLRARIREEAQKLAQLLT